MRIAHLQSCAGLRTRLLDGFLDELVEDLGQEESDGEEHALKLAAEEEVGDEAAEADEHGDEGDPGKEVPQRVAPPVANVRQRHCLQRRMRHRLKLARRRRNRKI